VYKYHRIGKTNATKVRQKNPQPMKEGGLDLAN